MPLLGTHDLTRDNKRAEHKLDNVNGKNDSSKRKLVLHPIYATRKLRIAQFRLNNRELTIRCS